MALFLLAEAIKNNKAITVLNQWKMVMDFTYIDDIAESISRLLFKFSVPSPNWDGKNPYSSGSSAPYQIFNRGN